MPLAALHGLQAVLFDLDDTLADTRALEPLRRARRWHAVSDALACVAPLPEAMRLLEAARRLGLPWGVVTSSPDRYARLVLGHLGLHDGAVLVAYHDTRLHKPHPDPLRLAAARLGVRPDATLYVGDAPADAQAARAAGMAYLSVAPRPPVIPLLI